MRIDATTRARAFCAVMQSEQNAKGVALDERFVTRDVHDTIYIVANPTLPRLSTCTTRRDAADALLKGMYA